MPLVAHRVFRSDYSMDDRRSSVRDYLRRAALSAATVLVPSGSPGDLATAGERHLLFRRTTCYDTCWTNSTPACALRRRHRLLRIHHLLCCAAAERNNMVLFSIRYASILRYWLRWRLLRARR